MSVYIIDFLKNYSFKIIEWWFILKPKLSTKYWVYKILKTFSWNASMGDSRNLEMGHNLRTRFSYLKASAELKMIWDTLRVGAIMAPLVVNLLSRCRTRVWPNRNAAAANSFEIDGFVCIIKRISLKYTVNENFEFCY